MSAALSFPRSLPRSAALGLLGSLALSLSLALAGCNHERADDAAPAPTAASPKAQAACSCEAAGPVVDAVLLSFLSKAKALHHQADMAEERKDPAAAIAALERVLSPAPDRPEADEVIADTRARLAELRVGRGELDAASRDLDEGLRKAGEVSYFRGHLFEVKGLVEEKRGRALDQAGDRAGAEQARKRAVEASEQAVKIQDEVIRRALEAPGARP